LTSIIERPFFGRVDRPLVAFSLSGDGLCRKLVGAGLLRKGWQSNGFVTIVIRGIRQETRRITLFGWN